MRNFLALLMLVAFPVLADVSELVNVKPKAAAILSAPTESDGIVYLTVGTCDDTAALAKGFKYYAYARDEGGIIHHGCWMPPYKPTAEETSSISKDAKIIIIVNLWFDGAIYPFPNESFGPDSDKQSNKKDTNKKDNSI